MKTLHQFQKEEKTVGSKGQAQVFIVYQLSRKIMFFQIEKQKEVERRLEETEKENRERLV